MRSKWLQAMVWSVILLAVPVFLLLSAFGLPPQYQETYLGGLSQKYERLSSAKGKRILLVGGSGTVFGYRSDLLREAFPDYEVVNFGLYAGLGTTVMLDLAEPFIHEGDIVVFSPEQSSQTLSDYFNAEMMWQASDGHFSMLRHLGPEYRASLLGQFPDFATAKAKLWLLDAAPRGDGLYARSSLNDWGDMTSLGRTENIMPGGYDTNMPISFDPGLLTDAFCRKVNQFAASCFRQGAAFCYRFCPMNRAAISEESLAELPAFTEVLRDRLDCPLLGRPEDSILVPNWFYDTNFHLNASGAIAQTALLIRDLQQFLGDSSPVSVPLPPMPALAAEVVRGGDNQDEGCFVYETVDRSAWITGLSETGKTQERLTLPVSFGGIPVTGFSAETFRNNTVIREIIFQSNIRRIEDASFEGCSHLQRLVLHHDEPNACTVGSGLLDGTDAMIIVPRELLSTYATNYFWSRYASRLQPESTSASTSVSPPVTPAPAPSGSLQITYVANGGILRLGSGDTFTESMESPHLRINTALGTRYLLRDGFVLLGWNTQADGSGLSVGLGSRTERVPGLRLYAQWAEASPSSCFQWDSAGNQVTITGFLSESEICVIPEEIDGLPVRRIAPGAFHDRSFSRLVFPSSLRVIDEKAFENCALQEVYLFDSLQDVHPFSFVDCPLTCLHINAATSPKYSGSYFDTFSDKYDHLLSIRTKKKIVLFSGSSGRYGYDTPMILRAFPEYDGVNMGVYAFTNALPQLDLIRPLMQPEDILLSAPEFDAVQEQFCTVHTLDIGFWAMMESNYDAASLLNLTSYDGVWTSFAEYLKTRSRMVDRSYHDAAVHYDDDGNYYPIDTYNRYGDFILPRPNSERDERLRHNIADYTVKAFPESTIASLNQVYQRFLEDGILVFFSYTPRNHLSLTEDSTPEARAELHHYLETKLCVPVISEVEESLYSGIYFWLIDSHLSTEGVKLRTAQIISDLRNALDD